MPESTKPPKPLCVMGFDFGLHHIGVAVGQTLTGSASPLGTIINHQGAINWQAIGNYIEEWKPALLVVGLPLNMDGSRSPLCERVERFARQLDGRFGLPVTLCDERLSSYEAKSRHRAGQQYQRDNYAGNYVENPVDDIAAQCILETWLNEQA